MGIRPTWFVYDGATLFKCNPWNSLDKHADPPTNDSVQVHEGDDLHGGHLANKTVHFSGHSARRDLLWELAAVPQLWSEFVLALNGWGFV
jgi:hypothetical protein